jgi:hypothetical protein
MNSQEKRANDEVIAALELELAVLKQRIANQRLLGRLNACVYRHLTERIPSPCCSTPEKCSGLAGCPREPVCGN